MKIENIATYTIRLPFDPGGKTGVWSDWRTLDHVLIRIDTDAGISGWGEAFGYGAAPATKAALDRMIAPALIGRDAADIAGTSDWLQRANHLWGRYGVTLFAISGIDIALWDIAAKAAGVPLFRLLGGPVRETVPAYASLFKYQDPALVAERTSAALAQGYGHVKLHETGLAEVAAAREAAGDDVAIMLDTNCPWSPTGARDMVDQLRDYDLYWLEEPIFPPENFAALADLRMACNIPIAAGENACTSFEFQKMFEAGAVTYGQPSVTKVGGITEFRKVLALAEVHGIAIMPHSPYFGPGFLATLHLLASMPQTGLCERFYLSLEASLYGDLIDPKAGAYRVPEDPGLGREPDPDVIKDYAAPDA